ncbi:VOC family protein [Spirosoma lituiforme]
MMQFLSLEPFVPSGTDFDKAKQLFQAVGFTINWDAGDYVGFERDSCKFILQKYDNVAFAENLMLNVRITNADEFWQEMTEKQLPETFGIRLSKPTDQSYGREVNLIDLAGVCWHFVS